MAEVMTEFYEVRLDLYRKRKEFLEGQLAAESLRLSEQARFIMEKIEGKVVIGLLTTPAYMYMQLVVFLL